MFLKMQVNVETEIGKVIISYCKKFEGAANYEFGTTN